MPPETDSNPLTSQIIQQLTEDFSYLMRNHKIASARVGEHGEIIPAVGDSFDYAGALVALRRVDETIRNNGLYSSIGASIALSDFFNRQAARFITQEPPNATLNPTEALNIENEDAEYRLFHRIINLYHYYRRPADSDDANYGYVTQARDELPEFFTLVDNLFAGLEDAVSTRVNHVINRIEQAMGATKTEDQKYIITLIRNLFSESEDVQQAVRSTIFKPKNLLKPDKALAIKLVSYCQAVRSQQMLAEKSQDPITRNWGEEEWNAYGDRINKPFMQAEAAVTERWDITEPTA